MTKMANDFMSKNPDIKIDIQQSTHSDVKDYLNMQILSGTLPDVFFYWTNGMSPFVEYEAVMDLTPYTDGWKDTFINDGESWEIANIEGKYYNMPFRATGYTIVYNKTLFESLDVQVPTTVQEFETVLEKIRKSVTNQAFSPLAATGVPGGTLPQLYTAFCNFVALQNEQYKDPAYTSGLLARDDTQLDLSAKVLDKLRDWVGKGYFGYAEGKSERTAITNFVQGNAAMVLMNNNNLYLLEDMDEEIEIGFTSIPAPAGIDYKYVYGGFDGFAIANNTKYPEECVRFLKYLSNVDVQQEFANSEFSIMAVDGVQYSDPDQIAMSIAMRDVGNAKLAQPDIKYSVGSYGDENSSLALNFLLGKSNKTAAQVIATIDSNNTKAVKDAGLNRVARTHPYPADADYSWLTLIK
jgi:raffinose/stachyose/melibiose transport system substrate-binding protein